MSTYSKWYNSLSRIIANHYAHCSRGELAEACFRAGYEAGKPNEYKFIPQTVCVQEGTVINITDGDFRGKWVSTKEGWVPYKLTPSEQHENHTSNTGVIFL